jgi:tRNA-dihydrouridine synthase
MLGRGILGDPFLLGKLQGNFVEEKEQQEMKWQFHEMIFESYRQVYTDEGQVLMKMKQFWSYFSNCFPNPPKTYKPIKKASKLSKFLEVYPSALRNS